MAFNIETLLAELNTEKTASQVVEQTPVPAVPATPAVPAAPEVPAAVETPKVEETEKQAADASIHKWANYISENEKSLVKLAEEFGQIAAASFHQELVAMGILSATNKDMQVPPISQVSQPMESTVTVARDAAAQTAAGHDSYDNRFDHVQTEDGTYMKVEKKASAFAEISKNMYNKLFTNN